MSKSLFCKRDGTLIVAEEHVLPGAILVGRGAQFVKTASEVAEPKEDGSGELVIPGIARAHLDQEAGLLIAGFAAKVRRSMPEKLAIPAREAA